MTGFLNRFGLVFHQTVSTPKVRPTPSHPPQASLISRTTTTPLATQPPCYQPLLLATFFINSHSFKNFFLPNLRNKSPPWTFLPKPAYVNPSPFYLNYPCYTALLPRPTDSSQTVQLSNTSPFPFPTINTFASLSIEV